MLARLSILFLLLTACRAEAQERDIPLEAYLSMLEQRHGVRFSFIDAEVHGVRIKPIDRAGALPEQLRYIQEQTGLAVTVVAPGYVVVQGQLDKKGRVKGVVLDAATNAPLPYATVRAPMGTSAVADKWGCFELELADSTVFHISHIGYRSLTVSWSATEIMQLPVFKLDRQPVELSETSVTHFLTKGIQKKTGNSYYIMPKETGMLPGDTEPDVLRTLRQMPGIISVNQSVSDISVRGGTHDQNLFVWNGIRLFQTGHFFGLISAFNPNLPHAITVYKNGTPATYGESVSGTVVIDSRPGPAQVQERSAGLNLVNADFNVAVHTSPKTYWQFSGRRSFTDFMSFPIYRRYSDRVFQHTKVTNFFADQPLDYTSEEVFYFYDATAQVNHQIDATSAFRANAILIANSLNVTQSSQHSRAAETSTLSQSSLGGNIAYEKRWNQWQTSDAQASLSAYQLQAKDFRVDNDQVTLQRNDVLALEFSAGHHILLQRGFAIDLGYQLDKTVVGNNDQSHFPDTSWSSDASLLNHAWIVQGRASFKSMDLSAGIRQHYFAAYRQFRTEPRLMLSYQWGAGWRLTLLGETKSQTAYQEIHTQQDFFGVETRRWKLANGSDVPLIGSQQLSLEIQFQRDNWLITAEPFVKQVNNISGRSQGLQYPFERYGTIGDYTVKGMEVLVQKQSGHFTGWVNGNINRSAYFFPDLNPQTFRNHHHVPLALRSGFIYDNNTWQGAIGSTWYAGRYYSEPASRIPGIRDDGTLFVQYDSPNGSRLADHFQVDLSGSLNVGFPNGWRLRTGFAMQNAFNTATEISRYYRINPQSEMIEEVKAYTLKRTWNVFARLYF